jgi:hypothetical protein
MLILGDLAEADDSDLVGHAPPPML